MKELEHKINQTITAIIILCIVVYGIVDAQQVCCNAFKDTCIPIFDRASVNYGINNSCRSLPSHNLNYKLQSNLCFKNYLADFGSGNTCCETDCCDDYNQTTEFSLSTVQDAYLLKKSVTSFGSGYDAQRTFQPYNLSTPGKAVSIYILTKSIIC